MRAEGHSCPVFFRYNTSLHHGYVLVYNDSWPASLSSDLTSRLSTAQTGFTAQEWVHALRVKACDWGRQKCNVTHQGSLCQVKAGVFHVNYYMSLHQVKAVICWCWLCYARLSTTLGVMTVTDVILPCSLACTPDTPQFDHIGNHFVWNCSCQPQLPFLQWVWPCCDPLLDPYRHHTVVWASSTQTPSRG